MDMNVLDNINAEKLALDQMLVDNIKNLLAARKDIVMLNNQLQKANLEIADLKKQIEAKLMCDPVPESTIEL